MMLVPAVVMNSPNSKVRIKGEMFIQSGTKTLKFINFSNEREEVLFPADRSAIFSIHAKNYESQLLFTS